MNGLKFLPCPNIEKSGASVSHVGIGLSGSDKNRLVRLVGLKNACDGILRIDPLISGTDTFEGLLRLKPTTRAPTNVIMPEEGSLRAGTLREQVPHRDLWRYGHRRRG